MDRSLTPVTCSSQVTTDAGRYRSAMLILRMVALAVILLAGFAKQSLASPSQEQETDDSLKQLSLAELGSVEVTTTSKEPEQVWKTAAAVYVLTQDDIRRS